MIIRQRIQHEWDCKKQSEWLARQRGHLATASSQPTASTLYFVTTRIYGFVVDRGVAGAVPR